MGHVVLCVPDVRRQADFYIDVLGFQPSDIITLPEPLGESWFLRTNPRHHSVALLDTPDALGLHHVCLESNSLDDVGYSYYNVLGGDTHPDLLLSLGRHVADQALSCYMHTPAGCFIEYGWGGLDVDDLEHRSPYNINLRNAPDRRSDMWGHHFRIQPNETTHPYAS
ncbi:VOC family protein [Streptomyces sp. NPDC006285]|uniref:VOC family protein n=1 Tax=Streptomyces sp. NPDC006285 TaxID=3364742 RepID=UPI003692965A